MRDLYTETQLDLIKNAAPEMYEALRKMERLVVELYPGHDEPKPEHIGEYQAVWASVMESRAALAKAEGKQP